MLQHGILYILKWIYCVPIWILRNRPLLYSCPSIFIYTQPISSRIYYAVLFLHVCTLFCCFTSHLHLKMIGRSYSAQDFRLRSRPMSPSSHKVINPDTASASIANFIRYWSYWLLSTFCTVSYSAMCKQHWVLWFLVQFFLVTMG